MASHHCGCEDADSISLADETSDRNKRKRKVSRLRESLGVASDGSAVETAYRNRDNRTASSPCVSFRAEEVWIFV